MKLLTGTESNVNLHMMFPFHERQRQFRCFAVVVLLLLSSSLSALNQTKAPAKPAPEGYPELPKKISEAWLTSIYGGSFRLADLKGKVVLVTLWATWCGPCRPQVPVFNELYDKHHAAGLNILAVNAGDGNDDTESEEAIIKYRDRLAVRFDLFSSNIDFTNEVSSLTKFQGIPQTFLVDRNGKLRGVFLGGSSKVDKVMVETLEKVMKEPE